MTATFVLLHGFTGSPASFDALAELLDPGARVIRPLLAGHGPEPALSPSWDAELARLTALLREAEVERACLCGYSLGGRLAFGLLARAPELFARAILVGAHPGLATAEERDARRASDRRWIELLERDGLEAFIAAWEALPLWASQARLDRAHLDAQRRIRRSHNAGGLAHALATLGLAEMPPVVPADIELPLTLVAGEHDAKHRALAAALAPSLPQGRIAIVPGAGHNVLLEQPHALADLLNGGAL